MEKYIQDFEEELSSIGLNKKLYSYLLEKAFSQASFYTYIPYELYRVLKPKSVRSDQVTKLAVASYAYFSLIIFFDKIRDKQLNELPHDKSVLSSYINDYLFNVHEYVIKTLAHLYSDGNPFWEKFNEIKHRFFEPSDKIVTKENLLNNLLSKSDLAEVYIYAFFFLVNEEERSEELTDFLKKFSAAMNDCHMAFQLFDDYKDLKEDLVNEQLNYYIFLGKELKERYPEKATFLKALYASEIVQDGMNLAMQYAENASKEFEDLGMTIHTSCADGLYAEINNEYAYIVRLMDKTYRKSTLSQRLFTNEKSLKEEISSSLEFLKSHIQNDAWEDFLTNAGLGKNWVTGYILTQIGSEASTDDVLSEVFDNLRLAGGCYNEYIVPDADSTSFLLKAMNIFKVKPSREFIKNWCKFRKDNGGFSTYYNSDIKKAMRMPETSDFTGWFTPQCCVTSVACWAASSFKDIYEVNNIYLSSRNFLLSMQRRDGSWPSYWWTSDIYATCFSILAMLDDASINNTVIDRALSYILDDQNDVGDWACNDHVPSTFFTALALNTLIEIQQSNRYRDVSQQISKGISWLRQNQFEDGSWKTARILRLPFPHDVSPELCHDWRRSSFGLNCLVDDHRRVFTTATVYNTLKKYEEYCL